MNIARNAACLAWLASGVLHAQQLKSLFEIYGSAEEIYLAFQKNEISDNLIHPAIKKNLELHSSTDDLRYYWKCMEDYNIHVLQMQDDSYPDLLKEISDAPPILFYTGNINILSERGKAAIIGSRKASVKGLNATETISRELAENDITIISGLAMGIDSAAHKGCISVGGKTAAVMGCGLDIVYPACNAKLKQQILDSGGVLISEYAPGEKPYGYHFPYRNRIISGVSDVIILMEARIKSGSMTTVSHALTQGRDVYSYPGDPDSILFEGNHQLLREGASFFTKARDIIEDMGWINTPKAQTDTVTPDLSINQAIIINQLKQGCQSFDELVQTTGLSTSVINEELTLLQLLDLIQALPGKQYKIVE